MAQAVGIGKNEEMASDQCPIYNKGLTNIMEMVVDKGNGQCAMGNI